MSNMSFLQVASVGAFSCLALLLTSNGEFTVFASALALLFIVFWASSTAAQIGVVLVMIGAATDLDLWVVSDGTELPPYIVVLFFVLATMSFARLKRLI